jgi:hypothetical protein
MLKNRGYQANFKKGTYSSHLTVQLPENSKKMEYQRTLGISEAKYILIELAF